MTWNCGPLLTAIVLNTVISVWSRQDFQEYCIREQFQAECKENQIILLEEARYGRMRTGRCISEEYGHIGCFADVTNYMDGLCSGRHACDVTVRKLMDIAQPCPADLTCYLEANYKCVTAELGTPEACHNDKRVEITSQMGYLSTMITEETGYGTSGCPWKIKVSPGQQVALTVFDFNLLSASTHGDYYIKDEYNSWCPISIVIEDQDIKKDIPLCNGGQRENHIYTSMGNELTAHFVIRKMQEIHFYFLVHYKASGCPAFDLPKEAWMVRTGENLKIQCNNTGEVWYLTCRDGQWIGEFGNCTGASLKYKAHVVNKKQFPFGLMLAIVIGIVLGIVIGLVLLGLVYILRKTYSSSSTERKGLPPDVNELYGSTTDAAQRAAFTSLIRQPHAHDPRIQCPAEYGTTQEREQLFKVEVPHNRREELLKKVECPRPPDVSNVAVRGNTVVTLKGHVYESPKFTRGNSFPPEVYHELGAESEDRRGKLTT